MSELTLAKWRILNTKRRRRYTPGRASKPVIYSNYRHSSGDRREDSNSAGWWRGRTFNPRSTWRPCSRMLRSTRAVCAPAPPRWIWWLR